MLQAQPEHGVYTVFVKLDNAKIEVRPSEYTVCAEISVERQKGLTTSHIHTQSDPFVCKLMIGYWYFVS